MVEQDFSLDLWGKEIYWKGKKVVVDMIAVEGDNKKTMTIKFKGDISCYTFAKIMRYLSFEPPFIIKEDCKHCEDMRGRPAHFCQHKQAYIDKIKSIPANTNCFNCPDYEKEKKLVRYYASVHKPNRSENPEKVYFAPLDTMCGVQHYLKVCPDTNRIYIDCEVEK